MAETASSDSPVPRAVLSLRAENEALARGAYLLNMIASQGTGLGEVIRDYARQTARELSELGECLNGSGDDPAGQNLILARVPDILRAAATVLNMTPGAMHRNHASVLGDNITPDDATEIARAFASDSEISRLISVET